MNRFFKNNSGTFQFHHKMAFMAICFSFLNVDYSNAQNRNGKLALDFSNPGFFAGSTLPQFYQRLYINGDYATMLKFTSRESRSKFGDDRLVSYFQRMRFGYEMKLKSRSYEEDGTQTLVCLAKINATSFVVRFKSKVENDTAKMVIENISSDTFP
jgi:hypothetical protein